MGSFAAKVRSESTDVAVALVAVGIVHSSDTTPPTVDASSGYGTLIRRFANGSNRLGCRRSGAGSRTEKNVTMHALYAKLLDPVAVAVFVPVVVVINSAAASVVSVPAAAPVTPSTNSVKPFVYPEYEPTPAPTQQPMHSSSVRVVASVVPVGTVADVPVAVAVRSSAVSCVESMPEYSRTVAIRSQLPVVTEIVTDVSVPFEIFQKMRASRWLSTNAPAVHPAGTTITWFDPHTTTSRLPASGVNPNVRT